MFSLALINSCVFFPDIFIKIYVISLLSFLSSITLYTGCFTWIILLFLGFKAEAFAAAIVGLAIFYWKGKETKDYRTKAFKEQNMASTTSWNWRKPIVMVKTLWYYMRVIFLPIKMGLYHVWGYFYEQSVERIDGMFWYGIAASMCIAFSFCIGDMAIRFGILWFFSFFFIFSNFITAQQFVADRYVVIPIFGVCVILSKLLFGTPFFWILFGLYVMRTFLHTFTFKNEIDFYVSNFLNFRKSEVSLGNLGVEFMNQGMAGAAVDTWQVASKINPHYDVALYNLYSVFKGNGRLSDAKDYLERCLNAKVVHFEKRWREELEQLNVAIEHSKTPMKSTELFYHDAGEHFKKNDTAREHECLKKFLSSDTTGLIPEMISQVKQRLAEIESAQNQLLHPMQEQTGQEAPRSN
jgi:hypothetical protein